MRSLRVSVVVLALVLLATRQLLPQGKSETPGFLGERLQYAMTILGIAGGQMTLTADETVWNGRRAFKFELSALSNDFLSKLFPVRDDMVSWVDPKKFRSLRFEKHTVEGKRVRDELTEFDYERGVARIDGVSRPLLDATLDSLSSVYYLRTLELDTDKPIELEVFAGAANALKIEVQGHEKIATPAGTFLTVRVEPKSTGSNLLGKNLILWLTDDDRKIPVQIQSKLKIGTLVGKLESIQRAIQKASPEAEGRESRSSASD